MITCLLVTSCTLIPTNTELAVASQNVSKANDAVLDAKTDADRVIAEEALRTAKNDEEVLLKNRSRVDAIANGAESPLNNIGGHGS